MSLVPLFDLSGKKALVTGGAVGIGRACATALAMAGADVVIAGRTAEAAEVTCGALREMGVSSSFVQCDVGNSSAVEGMIAETVRISGRLDIAINNAACALGGVALELSERQWEATFATNVTGLFHCARQQAKQMLAQSPSGGKIVNIGSIYATIAGGNCAYSASKAAVVQLTRCLAAEWGTQGINVNCISPGWTLTPANRHLSDEMRDRMKKVTPIGRLVNHRDIQGAVIYLCAPASDFVNGHNLVVDGGHSVVNWLMPAEHRGSMGIDEDGDADLRADLERYHE
jgi:NAD(P)-dependent dehydrogenase (short-subunit alcohol dehydrogenase family)